MFTVTNRIEVIEGATEQFESEFARSMRATLSDVPGLVRSTLLRPSKTGDAYVSIMEFSTKEAFHAWMGSDSFRAAHKGAADSPTTSNSLVETFETVEEIAA